MGFFFWCLFFFCGLVTFNCFSLMVFCFCFLCFVDFVDVHCWLPGRALDGVLLKATGALLKQNP